jgi:4-amino-4-deoxy-L-arabinose transferase-like glycosyltransferase
MGERRAAARWPGWTLASAATLVAILAVAFGLRILDLETNPRVLFEDELAGAASAWSIATTGHDVELTHLPFLETRLELKMPVYGYATLPFQAVLGHTPLAVRLPAVLFGTASTALVFWLARVLRRRRVEALLAAAVFATAPWAVHLGRIGWEPAAVLVFTLGGAGLLVGGLRDGRPWRVVGAAAVLAAGAYAYQPALLEHVLLALVITGAYGRRIGRRGLVALAGGAVAALALLVPYLLAFGDPVFTKRTLGLSVFRDGLTNGALSTAWAHYWAQWDPVYLFLGPTSNPRNGPGMGVLMPILAPILLVGLIRLVRRPGPEGLLILAWLAVAPVAAAVTSDVVPHFLRGVFALPPIVLVAAHGLEPLGARIVALAASATGTDRVRGFAGAAGIALLGGVLVQATFEPYFTRYPVASAAAWGLGTSAAMGLVRDTVPDGTTVCIDTATSSYWTFPQFVAWYLPGRGGSIVERVDGAERCAEPGAYLLARSETKVPADVVEVARLAPPASAVEIVLWRVPSAP